MADNNPISPGGALPPRSAEAAKVQPKKETVRINLPPKPTSAPTIKLPTLAPGTPPPAIGSAAPAATVVVVPAPSRAAAPPAPPASGAAPARMAAPATSVKPAPAPSAVPRPMMPVAVGLTGLDKGLAIAAAVISLGALGCVVYLAFLLKDTTAS